MQSTSTPNDPTTSAAPVITRRRLFCAFGLGAAAVIVTACADDAPGALVRPAIETDPPTEADVVRVLSNDNAFDPKVLEVATGTIVEWINGGANEHDILPAEGNPLTDFGVSPEDFPPRRVGTYRYRFTEPGTYDYYCSIHGNMRMKGMVGTVIVS